MTTYRNISPGPLEIPGLLLGREVAAAGEDDDTFESDVDVVHPLIERQSGSSWVNTAAAVDEAAQAEAERLADELQSDADDDEPPQSPSPVKPTPRKRTGGK